MAIGHFMMAFEPLFLFALTMLILGNGAFKPNMSAQVGGLYAPGDPRRDRAYSIFYVGINVGALLAPLICGTLGEEIGWHYGFAAAGIGMTIALLIYIRALRILPPDELHRVKRTDNADTPLDRRERLRIVALLPLFAPTTLFWATHAQQGNTIVLWADDHTNRYIDLPFWHGRSRSPGSRRSILFDHRLHAFPGQALGASGEARQRTWDRDQNVARLPRGGDRQLDPPAQPGGRRGRGQAGCGCSPISWSLRWASSTSRRSDLSLVSKLAPVRMVSMLIGLWLATSFGRQFPRGWLGSFWSGMDKLMFFLMIVGIAALAGAVISLFDRPLRAIVADQTVAA
jgi:POT family proton-dependent oligopeptide transporter